MKVVDPLWWIQLHSKWKSQVLIKLYYLEIQISSWPCNGEKASDATKKARKLIENHTIVRERKLGLMLESEGVALCSCEWKSIAASNAVVMKQYVKNLRVDNCMSCVKHWMMDFKV
ncbi:unnamed protein product [Rhizopus microsporus]